MFGNQHFVTLLFFLLFGYLLIKWTKKQHTKTAYRIGHYFALLLSFTVVVWTFIKIYLNGFDEKEDLPFHLCNIIALLIPVFTYTRKKLFFEIIFFWVLCGTSHSVITPDLVNGFPHFVFFKYWIVHAGLVLFVIFSIHIYKIELTLKSVFRSFGFIQIYILLMFLINKTIGSNYFYTNKKPESSTALDYLGEWPTYIYVVELIMIPYFLLVFLIYKVSTKKLRASYVANN
jgi:hypothetical integral membrane protein (TIGR02206 family)